MARALAAYEEARQLREQLVMRFPEQVDTLSDLARTCINMGPLQQDAGQTQAAAESYRKAIELKRELVKRFPDLAVHQIELGGAFCNLALLHRSTKDYSQAMQYLLEATRVLEAALKRWPGDTKAREFLANTFWGRAQTLHGLKRHRDAIADWDAALKLGVASMNDSLEARRAVGLARTGSAAGTGHCRARSGP